MKIGRYVSGLLLVAGGAVGTTAHAVSISYSSSYNGPTDVANLPIQVAQFDPALGTLTGATFTLGASMTTSAFAANDGDFYVGWDKQQYQFSLVGDTGYDSVQISASNPAQRVVGSGSPDGTFAFSFPGGGEYQKVVGQPNWTYAGPTLAPQPTVFAPGALAAFIGNSTLSFFLTTVNLDTLAVLGQQTFGAPSPAPFGLMTNILADVSVTYDYVAPVPLPGALPLFLSALAGLGVMLRRRRSAVVA